MKKIFGILFKAILGIILTTFIFAGIVLLTPVIALFMFILMLIGLYEITVWIIKEIKNKFLWKVF